MGRGERWWKPKEVEGAYGINLWKGIAKNKEVMRNI